MSGHLFRQSWFSSTILDEFNRLLQGKASADYTEQRLIAGIMWYLHEAANRAELDYEDMVRFFAFSIMHKQRSAAQLYQDLWVLFMTQCKRDGFFVEFGACDGRFLSNTWLLEREYGWRGILAEPDPHWHKALSSNRSCSISYKCVYEKSDLQVDFACATKPELSRLQNIIPNDVHERDGNRTKKETISVITISLLDLLTQYGAPQEIDYLSIDTEGSELEILQSMDFSRYNVKLLTVEHAGETSRRNKITQLLASYGYVRWFPDYTRWDDWYVRR